MRHYELVLIFHPDLDDEAVGQALEKVKGWVTTAKGSVASIDSWGKRRLAYMIQKQYEGIYFLLNLDIEPVATAELDRNLRILEPVMRYQIITK